MPAPKSIIIVGSGVFGLSTAHAMSQNDKFASSKITLIDSWNFEPSGPSASTPNPSAANFDTSRIIRSDYSHRIYATLAREAQQKWKGEWGADGRYHNQSIVMIGEGHSMKQPMKALENINYVKHAYAQSYERAGRNSDIVHILDSESAVWEALGLGTPDKASNVGPKDSELRGYRNHNCGWAESGATMAWLRQKTIHSDRVDIHIGQVVGLRVCSDSPSESHVNAEPRVCGVVLDDGSQLTADLTILAAGAMTPRLLGYPTLCDVYSETVAYVQLTEMERRELVRREFPLIVNVARKIFAIGPDNQGFLKLARFSWSGYRDVQKFAGVDVGPRSQGAPQEEDGYGTCGDIDQTKLSPEVESTLQDYRGFLRELFQSRDGGDLGSLRDIATRPFAQVRRCWYADTVSTDFIVDYHPAYGKSLFLATGGSDHAFKFLPVLGERICELILQSDNGKAGPSESIQELQRLWKFPGGDSHNPDPSIIRVKNDFFLVTSSFEYFPGAPIYHSTDLIRWTLIGHALTRRSQIHIQTPEPGGGVWATTLRYHGGVYYIIAASFERYRPQDDDRVWPRGFYVKTENIWDSGSWSDPVFFDQVGFDQDLFWDDDGTVYLSSTYRKLNRTPSANLKDFAIHIATIDLASGASTSEPKLIRESTSGVSEGSHIFKRGKYYYLFTAEGGTESGHCEWVSRSETGPFGPWEVGPNNPLWRNGVNDEVQNTGHADLVEDAQGRWWAVLLGVRPVRKDGYWEESVFGRETFLIPVEWKDDWPIFNGGKKISLQSESPHLYEYQHPVAWRDDFSSPELQLGWYRKNTPMRTDYSLTERPNHLRLYGGPYNLSVPSCPTLFLRKQIHHYCTWETKLSFNPQSPHTEAGTVVWWNYFTYSSIGIRLSPTKEGARIVRFRPAEGEVIDRELQSAVSDVVFFIECGDQYRFGFKEVNGTNSETQWIGEVQNSTMTQSPPVGAPFTGMMLGLYAFGERQRCLLPADFGYAEFI